MRLRSGCAWRSEEVLEAVAAALPAAERRVVEEQIAEINHVQRVLDWTDFRLTTDGGGPGPAPE